MWYQRRPRQSRGVELKLPQRASSDSWVNHLLPVAVSNARRSHHVWWSCKLKQQLKRYIKNERNLGMFYLHKYSQIKYYKFQQWQNISWHSQWIKEHIKEYSKEHITQWTKTSVKCELHKNKKIGLYEKAINCYKCKYKELHFGSLCFQKIVRSN